MDKEFIILYFVASDALLSGRLVPCKWNQAWRPSELYRCIEREKANFESREVNCLKECALALTIKLPKRRLKTFSDIQGAFSNVTNAISMCPLNSVKNGIITYLVSSRPYIEICRVCKIYGRRGGAEPSIYFTNPTYFYVRSGTDQISVLFHRGPLLFLRSTLQNKKIHSHCRHAVIDADMKVKAYFEVLWVRKSRQNQHYVVVRCATCKT